MPTWSAFLAQHPNPHVVIGWTRNVNRWREISLNRWISYLHPTGQFAWKRDIDPTHSRYLLVAAFANQTDAQRFALHCRARNVPPGSGYQTQSEYALSTSLLRKLNSKKGPRIEMQ
jgi:hypothetical protein